MSPVTVGDYRIIGELEMGSFGTVYRAADIPLDSLSLVPSAAARWRRQ